MIGNKEGFRVFWFSGFPPCFNASKIDRAQSQRVPTIQGRGGISNNNLFGLDPGVIHEPEGK
jgi:hypothetical protein